MPEITHPLLIVKCFVLFCMLCIVFGDAGQWQALQRGIRS